MATNLATDVGTGLAQSAGESVLKQFVNVLADDSRKLTLKLFNKTKQKWTKPRIFLNCGATDTVLPKTVENDGDVEYEIHKKKWTLHGIAGVVAYEWKESDQSYYLAVMFRKPLVYRQNNWNVIIGNDETEVDQEMFVTLKQQEGEYPRKRNDSNYLIREFGPYTVFGAMATTGAVDVTVQCTADLDD